MARCHGRRRPEGQEKADIDRVPDPGIALAGEMQPRQPLRPRISASSSLSPPSGSMMRTWA
jgi:hypothetical protein